MEMRAVMTDHSGVQALRSGCLAYSTTKGGRSNTNLRSLVAAQIRPGVRVTARDDQQVPQLRLRLHERRDVKGDDQLMLPNEPARQPNLTRHLAAHIASAHAITLHAAIKLAARPVPLSPTHSRSGGARTVLSLLGQAGL